jgi:collagen type III alpha
VTDDPVLAAVQRFMDAVETRVGTLADETRALLTDAALHSLSCRRARRRAARSGPQGERGERRRRRAGRASGTMAALGPQASRASAVPTVSRVAMVRRSTGRTRSGSGHRSRRPMGERGADGSRVETVRPARGAGERGADGIATRAELDARIEARFAELQVRTFADSYREVYRAGEQYRRGETVTWGGSLFLAMADTTDKPETTPDWR